MLHIRRAEDKFIRGELKQFVNEHHSYIKWADRPSRKLYWGLYEDDILVGVFGLSSGFVRPLAIKQYMEKNSIEFNEIGNNIVYCLHGTQTENAGTRFLKLVRRDACAWWKERYGDTLKVIQTFILPPRTGAVYKADNWVFLGETKAGISKKVRTLYGDDKIKYAGVAEIRTFNNGETKYLLHIPTTTEHKLMFIRKI